MPHHNSVLPAPWNDGESPQILRDGFQTAAQASYRPPFQQVALKNILIQSGQAGPLDGALIVMQMVEEGLIAVQLIIGHLQVCIAYPDIGAFHPASTFIIAGALG